MEDRFTHIVKTIDQKVSKAVSNRNSQEQNDTAVLKVVQDHIHDFKTIMDGTSQDELNKFCEQYEGFYLFANFMERFAGATARGAFSDIH